MSKDDLIYKINLLIYKNDLSIQKGISYNTRKTIKELNNIYEMLKQEIKDKEG